MTAGRPLRLELYGLALAGSVAVFLVYDRVRYHSLVQEEILRQLKIPSVVQNNNQQVIIDDSDAKLILELAAKRGWENGDVSRTQGSTGGTEER